MKKSSRQAPKPGKMFTKISLMALFAALIAAGAFIAIPIGPVPIVLQNFFVLLSGLVLGPFMGTAAVGIYLLAGILSFPVFAGGTGGIVRFAGPTGGFLAGYLLAALTAGFLVGRHARPSLPRLILAVTAGFLVVYVPGVVWLKISGNLSWTKAFLAGFVPFIAGDFIKGIAAVLIVPRLRRIAYDFINEK